MMSGKMMISDADRARWRELTEAATPGPWVVEEFFDEDDGTRFRGVRGWHDDGEEYLCLSDADANFVAAARTALPALLAENDRLRATLEAVGAAAAHTTDDLVPYRVGPTIRDGYVMAMHPRPDDDSKEEDFRG